MRKSVLNIIVLLVLILLSIECKKNDFTTSSQMILFQYDHTRGTNQKGYIIDSEGNVFIYNIDGMNFPNSDLEISQDKANEYMSNCDYTGMKIAGEELKKYTKYIEYIASSKVTAVRDKGNNTGTIRYICYQYDENTDIYRGQIIRMEGDNTSENLNFHSKKVSSWMRKVSRELSIRDSSSLINNL